MTQFQAPLRRPGYAFRVMRLLVTLLLVAVAGCDTSIYVRDGVTDGDTFYLSEQALVDDDPVLQSWVTYSLAKSACQLEEGGTNPARVNTYGCEFSSRQLLLDSWDLKRAGNPAVRHEYLDQLVAVREAGYLDEYVVHYFGTRHWQVPAEVDVDGFRGWKRRHLRGHRPETRLIGSWNYARPGRNMADSD